MDALTFKPVLTTTGLLCLSSAALIIILRPVLLPSPRPPFANASCIIPSPRQTLLPHLSPSQIAQLPYPPSALPGARAVPTPHGTIHVFEFGPLQGDRGRVLLLAGISTPCVSLSSLALALAERGYRVLLFDYFGRGWSDTPDPAATDHDEALYLSQILSVLASSDATWLGAAAASAAGDAGDAGGGGFHVVGYSFGGGLAASFAAFFPRCVRSVTVIAPGGLMKTSGISWRTRLLYSRGWLLPERVQAWFVRRRFAPLPRAAAAPAALVEQAEVKKGDDDGPGKDDDPFEDAMVSPALPGVTVAQVMAWQVEHHRGFIPAVMSSFRYGPIHERYDEWGRLDGFLAERRADASLPGLLGGKVLLVLGRSDSIVKEAQIVPAVKDVLGDDGVEVVLLDAGHEVAITKGSEIADACVQFWCRASHV